MQRTKQAAPTSKVICSDNMAALKEIPDNSVDAVVTDPPYGLGKEPNAIKVLQDWITQGYHNVKSKSGFMNKTWDAFVPQPNFWKEVFRVLKPGGHMLVFGGTRTYDWMVMSLRLAGFEVRDQMQWIYGSGFPKSMNISKQIDKQAGAEREVIGKKEGTYADIKMDKITGQDGLHGGIAKDREQVECFITAPATDAAKQWDGWGTALKPAHEPICLARKPILEKTIVDNVLLHGTGGINIDDSRIGYTDENDLQSATFGRGTDIVGGNFVGATQSTGETNSPGNQKGRWPANIILSHHPDCKFIGKKQVKGSLCKNSSDCNTGTGGTGNAFAAMQGNRPPRGHGNENNEETVENWDCHADCPVKILDGQSGLLKTGAMKKAYTYTNSGSSLGTPSGKTQDFHEANEGGASRFFYCAKASRSEKNKGLKINQNNHPTVKPVKLMQYLIRLITPPGGTVLDPFNGSGTTGIGCKLEGLNYIGIDDDQRHCDLSTARIAAWEPEQEEYDNQLELNFE